MKVSIPGFIHLRTDQWADDTSYGFTKIDIGGGGDYVTICEHTLEFEVPEGMDPRSLRLKSLQEEKIKLLAAFQNRVTEIERKISELTCLEMAA
jgi:hypothetical protein